MLKLLVLSVLCMATTAPLAGQSVAGDWEGTLNTPGAQVPLKFTLKVKGDSLSGIVNRTSGDVVLTGRVKGDSVIVQYTIEYGGNPFTMSLRGRVKGDSLGGIVDFGGGNEDAFSAKRIVKKPETPSKPLPPRES